MSTERDDWIADHLLDLDDRADWERQRNEDLGLCGPRPSRAEMIAACAAETAAVENAQPRPWVPYRRDQLRWIASLAVERQDSAEDAA